jgi:multicomponent K+:H+ antiporter subunit D
VTTLQAVVVALLVLPLLAGAALFVAGEPPPRDRVLAGIALALELALALAAAWIAAAGLRVVVRLPAPTGLVGLVLDRLSALMLLVSTLIACLAWAYDSGTPDPSSGRRRSQLQLQLLMFVFGIAFLTASLFWLIVALEAAVFSACALIATRAGAVAAVPVRGLRHANLAVAAAFVLSLACLHQAVGTLDLAELAHAAPAAPAGALPWLTLAEGLMLAAFVFTAVVVPIALWLPGEFGATPVAVRLVAIPLVALNIYALLRVVTLAFPCFGAGPCGPSAALLPAGLATMAAGALATFWATRRRERTAFLMTVSTGTVLIALGGLRVDGLAAAIFLVAQGTLAGAALCLATDLAARRGAVPPAGGRVPVAPLRGVAVLALAGLAPSPAFVGIVALLLAAGPAALTVWTLVLSSLLLVSAALLMDRGGIDIPAGPPLEGRGAATTAVLAVCALGALAIAAGPAFDFASAAARQLLDRSGYVSALQGEPPTAGATLEAASSAPH